MKIKYLYGVMLMMAGLGVQQAAALEVDREVLPRITAGGRLVATPAYISEKGYKTQGDESANEIDVSDSSFLLRFDKRIYSNKGVAGAMLGLRKTSSDSDLPDDIFFHQLNAFFWNRDFQTLVGRTRLRNFLQEFPTARDEDLQDYIYVPNATSYAENEEYQFYAPQLSFDWFVDRKRNALSLWAASQVETDITGDRTAKTDLNTAGTGWKYAVSEDLRYVERLREAGVFVQYQKVNDEIAGIDDGITSVIAGAAWNLNRNPAANWSMAAQGIYSNGIDNVDVDTIAGTEAQVRAGLRRAKFWSAVVSASFTHRPKLLTRSRSSLTLAYKDFPEGNRASQFSIVPSFVYRLGHVLDLTAQYSYTRWNDGLARLTGFEAEQRVLLGLVFGFEQRFNDQIGERDSILNLEHGYIQ